MAVGTSNRIVIDVKEGLKRRLYSALAQDGLSLKAWFIKAAEEYLDGRERGRQLDLVGIPVAGAHNRPTGSGGGVGERDEE